MSVNEDSNDNDTNTDAQSKSPTSGCEIELRRGDCVDAAGKYATFLDYTPKRTGARIVERTQNSKPGDCLYKKYTQSQINHYVENMSSFQVI